jgi:hypothetical protein
MRRDLAWAEPEETLKIPPKKQKAQPRNVRGAPKGQGGLEMKVRSDCAVQKGLFRTAYGSL